MDERKRGLIRNTSILMIGNFASKLLAYILVPLYTHYLVPADYGEVDIYLTALSMIFIIVSMQSIESAFRFIQDNKTVEDRVSTISNAMLTAFAGVVFFSVVMTIFGMITSFRYTVLFILYVATNIFAVLMLHTIRGMNKTTSYVVISIISTIISVLCNILFIVGLGLGSQALLVSPIMVNIAIILIIIFKEQFLQYIKLSVIRMDIIKTQLHYSLPLIPNAISIWLLSSIGRYVLLIHYDTSAVGLLAFSLKFPAFLGAISSIFFMAWQVSAISQYDSKDRDSFASDIFNQFSILLLASLVVILPVIKITIFTIMGDAYRGAWIYIPVFLIGEVFKAFALFFSIGFYGAKETKYVFHSSMIAAGIYFLVSQILVKPLFILGIAIAYTLSEFVHWFYITLKVTPYMKISIKYRSLLGPCMVIAVYFLIYYLGSIKIQVFALILGLLLVVLINWGVFSGMMKIACDFLKKHYAKM